MREKAGEGHLERAEEVLEAGTAQAKVEQLLEVGQVARKCLMACVGG